MKNILNGKLILSSVLSMVVAACGNNSSQIENSLSTTKPMARGQTLSPALNAGDLSVDRNYLMIKNTALEKDFLLQSSFSIQLEIPLPSGAKSRVVSFKQRGDTIIMLESNRGQQISKDLPQDLLISTFPILARDGEWIVFDFAQGMSKAFVGYDWYASDFQGPLYQPDYYAVSVADSYLDYARVSANNTLTLRQIVQLNDFNRMPIEVKYYLSEYSPTSGFSSFVNTVKNFDWFGFFEVQPTLKIGGESLIHASKWSGKSITYAISANTPAEWRQAIRDGVLYWNKAFGAEVVKVVDAPVGIVAPDADYNVIQWIDWDDAGFAYADAQMDPLTGEILHAQIFMTSAFAHHGSLVAKEISNRDASVLADRISALRMKGPKSFRERKSLGRAVAIRGMEKGPLCFEDHTATLMAKSRDLTRRGISEEMISTMTSDYIREVIAHEVGHTLGLRHNFAGSLDTPRSMAQLEESFMRYASTGEIHEGDAPTSSVMDYQRFQEGALTGALIRNREASAFRYDAKAIDILYKGANPRETQKPLYCSDLHSMLYVDCLAFDASASVADSASSAAAATRKNLAFMAAEAVAQWRMENRGENLNDLPINRWDFISALLMPTFDTYFAFVPEYLPYLSVERRSQKSDDLLSKTNEMLNADVLRLGGFSAILPAFSAAEITQIKENTKKLLADGEFMRKANSREERIDFSAEELETLSTLVDEWFGEEFVRDLMAEDLLVSDALRPFTSLESLQTYLFERASHYFTERGEGYIMRGSLVVKTKAGKKVTLQVDIPRYQNGESLQTTWATLVAEQTGMGPTIADLVLADVKRSLGGRDHADFDFKSAPLVSQWLASRLQLVATLRGAP